MVNNDFSLIGVAISPYESIGNSQFAVYNLRIEIEKFGAKTGYAKTFQIDVQVYGTNKVVNTNYDILGKQVAVRGYIDSYESKEGVKYTKLVAQNVLVLERKKRPVTNNQDTMPEQTIQDIANMIDEPKNSQVSSANDDELPF